MPATFPVKATHTLRIAASALIERQSDSEEPSILAGDKDCFLFIAAEMGSPGIIIEGALNTIDIHQVFVSPRANDLVKIMLCIPGSIEIPNPLRVVFGPRFAVPDNGS